MIRFLYTSVSFRKTQVHPSLAVHLFLGGSIRDQNSEKWGSSCPPSHNYHRMPAAKGGIFLCLVAGPVCSKCSPGRVGEVACSRRIANLIPPASILQWEAGKVEACCMDACLET